MSGKKRRRPEYRPPQQQAAETKRPQTPPATEEGGRRPAGILGFLNRGAPVSSPYPPIRRSIGRAFVAVCSQPVLLGTIFLLVFVVREGLLVLGFPPRTGFFAATLALPPVSAVLDADIARTIFGESTGIIMTPVLLLVRTLIVAMLTGMVAESVEHGRVTLRGIGAGLRGSPGLLGAAIIGLGAVFIGSLVVSFTGLGLLGVVGILAVVLFFLGYAPIVAVRYRKGLTWTVRKAVRAGRIPGSQNAVLATIYSVLALLVIVALVPAGSDFDANPAITTWIGILLANVIHVVMLGVYVHRFLWAEGDIPDPPEPAPRRR